MSKRQPIVKHIHPPIPIRLFDYCACFNEEYGPYGWGETRERAIDDLEGQMGIARFKRGDIQAVQP